MRKDGEPVNNNGEEEVWEFLPSEQSNIGENETQLSCKTKTGKDSLNCTIRYLCMHLMSQHNVHTFTPLCTCYANYVTET